jgi:hypothetical protein
MEFKMEKYKTMADFGGVGAMALLESIVTAVPVFFPVTLFVIWIFGTASSYFMILKTTGKKRFWHSLTAMAFVCFLSSLLMSAMNTATTTYLSGYWVGFYILMTIISWFFLENYK